MEAAASKDLSQKLGRLRDATSTDVSRLTDKRVIDLVGKAFSDSGASLGVWE